jgi:hypothetical protein
MTFETKFVLKPIRTKYGVKLWTEFESTGGLYHTRQIIPLLAEQMSASFLVNNVTCIRD